MDYNPLVINHLNTYILTILKYLTYYWKIDNYIIVYIFIYNHITTF